MSESSFSLPNSRRDFLRKSLALSGFVALAPSISQVSAFTSNSLINTIQNFGPLLSPNGDGIRLPQGFTSRVIAISNSAVANTNYRWHRSPDGGACFPTTSGGWIYTSNSEELSFFGGGASAIEFDALGNIIDARRILSNTSSNCAGGATPWNTWLSCEERDRGAVYETDPYGNNSAIRCDALGYFKHEAAAVDPVLGQIYMTEDESDGCLYRFTPNQGLPNITSGTLEVAVIDGNGLVSWQRVPNPNPSFWQRRTRHQLSQAYHFDGGEGIWYHQGFVFFATKGDNRVWVLDTNLQQIDILYSPSSNNPILSGVDNVTVAPTGEVLVAEDGGDMQIVVLDSSGNPTPLLQVVNQSSSEIAGPAFSPDGTRLYFSSQRGASSSRRYGITYEVRGPFTG